MDKWNLIVDVALCENCNNCVLAAKDELVGNDFPGYSAPHPALGPGVIRLERAVRGVAPRIDVAYLPKLCNHCDDAPCVKAGVGAVVKRVDGIVLFDPEKARGRRDLVDACPLGAVVWNEAANLPQTWFFDAHLLDAGAAAPRCVPVCPTGAIEAVKTPDAAMAQRAEAEQLRTLQPTLRSRVYYRHLARFDRRFIAGAVSCQAGGRDECAQGVAVTLRRDGELVATTCTDAFGEFRLDGLVPRSGCYDVALQHVTFGSARRDGLVLDEASVDLGVIALG